MPKQETILKCASIAAYHSKAKFSSHVPVDYTLIKYVKKSQQVAFLDMLSILIIKLYLLNRPLFIY